ncbi:MAG: TIGR02391 family protein [Firmicutes bacterium]|nr:TIGR02391 family protein [Bacillota bacterium]
MQQLYSEAEALLGQVSRHKARTISQRQFLERARGLCVLWQGFRPAFRGEPEIVEKLDESFDKLLAMTEGTSQTNEYRKCLKTIVGTTLRSVVVPEQAKNKYEEAFLILRLHPRIEEVSRHLFQDGHYAQAVLEAYKALNIAVKDKSGVQLLDGQKLMSRVFDEDAPRLRLNDLQSESDKDEQRGYKFIFMGVMTGIRNPKAHEIVKLDDPVKASELLLLASLLMKHVDSAAEAV